MPRIDGLSYGQRVGSVSRGWYKRGPRPPAEPPLGKLCLPHATCGRENRIQEVVTVCTVQAFSQKGNKRIGVKANVQYMETTSCLTPGPDREGIGPYVFHARKAHGLLSGVC
jgi:hypothetical protein